MVVRIAQPADLEAIANMCATLWSGFDDADTQTLQRTLQGAQPGILPHIFLIAEDSSQPVGFAEVSLRSYADGCDPAHPVGFLEGWFVADTHRGCGAGRALLEAAENWARGHGCTEFASDTWIDNAASQRAHEALGFEVVDRCVHYRKSL